MSRTGWTRVATFAWLVWRPPSPARFTLRSYVRRRIVTLLVVVPLGLLLASLVDRYADHPVVRLLTALLDDPDEPPPAGPASA